MCGRTACSLGADDIQRRYGVPDSRVQNRDRYRPSNNVGPGRFQPILQHRAGSGGSSEHAGMALCFMKWGLIPSWSKERPDYKGTLNTINARAETVATTPMYRSLVKGHRCVVVAEGFYEWKDEGAAAGKQPYFVYFADGRPLTMAGLYSHWQSKDTGEQLDSYTIITVDSSKALSWLHNRMPAILPDHHAINEWLDPEVPFDKLAAKYLVPYAGDLKWHKVSKDVGNVKNDRPDLAKPLKEAPKITSFFSKAPTTPKKEPITSKRPATDDGPGPVGEEAKRPRNSL